MIIVVMTGTAGNVTEKGKLRYAQSAQGSFIKDALACQMLIFKSNLFAQFAR